MTTRIDEDDLRIFEVVFKTDDGLDHTVVTAAAKSVAKSTVEHETVDISDKGPFRTQETFEEIRQDILERGVPEDVSV